jgi:hypothetical protein
MDQRKISRMLQILRRCVKKFEKSSKKYRMKNASSSQGNLFLDKNLKEISGVLQSNKTPLAKESWNYMYSSYY